MGAIDTSYTFTATDVITSAKMNNILDQSTITSSAIIGTTLSVSSGKLSVASGGITSNEMGSNSVTTVAITDGNVTSEKISTGGPTWNGTGQTNVSPITSSIANLTIGSARTASGASKLELFSTFPVTTASATISRESGANGNIVITNTGTGSLVLGTAPIPIPASNSSGTAPIYGARAWCNFDGTRNAAGTTNALFTTRFIRSSGYIASVTKTANGKYDVLFTSKMKDSDYAVVSSFTTNQDSTDDLQKSPKIYGRTDTGFSIAFYTFSGSLASVATDPKEATFAVFGN